MQMSRTLFVAVLAIALGWSHAPAANANDSPAPAPTQPDCRDAFGQRMSAAREVRIYMFRPSTSMLNRQNSDRVRTNAQYVLTDRCGRNCARRFRGLINFFESATCVPSDNSNWRLDDWRGMIELEGNGPGAVYLIHHYEHAVKGPGVNYSFYPHSVLSWLRENYQFEDRWNR